MSLDLLFLKDLGLRDGDGETARFALLLVDRAFPVFALPHKLLPDAFQPIYGEDLEFLIDGWSKLKESLDEEFLHARLFILSGECVAPSPDEPFTITALEGFEVGKIDGTGSDVVPLSLAPNEFLMRRDLVLVKYRHVTVRASLRPIH